MSDSEHLASYQSEKKLALMCFLYTLEFEAAPGEGHFPCFCMTSVWGENLDSILQFKKEFC